MRQLGIRRGVASPLSQTRRRPPVPHPNSGMADRRRPPAQGAASHCGAGPGAAVSDRVVSPAGDPRASDGAGPHTPHPGLEPATFGSVAARCGRCATRPRSRPLQRRDGLRGPRAWRPAWRRRGAHAGGPAPAAPAAPPAAYVSLNFMTSSSRRPDRRQKSSCSEPVSQNSRIRTTSRPLMMSKLVFSTLQVYFATTHCAPSSACMRVTPVSLSMLGRSQRWMAMVPGFAPGPAFTNSPFDAAQARSMTRCMMTWPSFSEARPKSKNAVPLGVPDRMPLNRRLSSACISSSVGTGPLSHGCSAISRTQRLFRGSITKILLSRFWALSSPFLRRQLPVSACMSFVVIVGQNLPALSMVTPRFWPMETLNICPTVDTRSMSSRMMPAAHRSTDSQFVWKGCWWLRVMCLAGPTLSHTFDSVP
mmetsp:Transcript_135/g.202  ORF Transcript_135/g.202 Transcript_135/m.202 type:complete len:420 (+) Transcript_135:676-1935(+)